jgi:uncharacterized protein (DUF1697 family)
LAVAFFRNLNQGQRGSPSRAQFVEAFAESGAIRATPFQSNGTMLLDAQNPTASTQSAIAWLTARSGWSDAAFVRSVDWLTGVLAAVPIEASTATRIELSLFDESSSAVHLLPLTGTRCTVFSGGPGFAVTENERDNESNATPTLERALGVAVTSRGFPTLSRVVERLASES